MTGIADHIRDEVFGARLRRSAVLVVYDARRRYRELCLSLADDTVAVVDASESSIESREAAAHAFVTLGRGEPGPKELLIHVPAPAPLTDEERQIDPFSAYTVCGAFFPASDGDDYLSLCLKAKPDHATEIRRLFEQDPSPSFALIDNIGGGLQWPTLRTLLQAESARDILFALLVPSPKQTEALQANEARVNETRAVLAATLGLKLITRGKTWSSIADELWRFVLFSEFVFDLPSELPAGLVNVPRASEAARPLVEDLCERLRNDARTRAIYIERAEQTETDLDLPSHCQEIADLGVRDTFPFEERTILAASLRSLEADRLDDIRDIVGHHRGSVWIGRGESQAQWGLLEAALRLVECCDDAERQLADHARGLDDLIGYYVSSLCKVDRRQREFEQSTGGIISPDGGMMRVIGHSRQRYARLIEKLSVLFTRHLEATGWPPPGRLANADVFNRFVQPLLSENGRRVAYFLVDALRYELGVALHSQLAETDQAELLPACAQLPTVTPVGMASLLPDAGSSLRLAKEGDGFVAVLGGARLVQVGQRMEVLRARFGDRFAEMPLGQFAAVEGRDEKGIKKTLCAFLKILHPADEPTDEQFEEYVAYAVECRRRIKEQMNKRKPDDEFARIDLSYIDANGKEIVVYCPESQNAKATLEPARRRLETSDNRETGHPGLSAPPAIPLPIHEEIKPPTALQRPMEQHFAMQYGDTGHTYETIFGRYLADAKAVTIEDPYIRAPHQIANFVRFCETVITVGPTVRRINLITGYDDKTDLAMVRDRLEELKQSLLEIDVLLDIELSEKIHDREVRIDNGWTVKIGRGLDFYRKPDGWFSIGASDFALRKCLETQVDIFKQR